MVEKEERRKNWRPIMVVLGLLLGALLTASAAFASLPARVPAGVAASPPMQGKSDQGQQQQQQQAEDPAKGKLGPNLPDTISIDGKPQESVSGGTPLPTPCGPSSIYFELEPNNTITTAHVLGSKNNAEVRGAINSAGDIDYYSFVANAGDRIWAYAFTLGAVSSTDTQLQLLDALSTTLQFDDDNGSQADLSSAIAGKVVTQTATYYLRVNAFSSTSTVMPYTLFIDRTSTAPVPEVEPNNTFTQPNPYVVGSVVTGTINVTTDLDVYSFEFFDDDRYVFQVDGDPERDGSEFNPNFDLMNAAGAVLVTVDSDSQFDVREVNSENAAFFIDTGGPPTATLLLRVRPEGATTGTYALHIWRVGEVPCGNSPTPTVTNTATPVCNTFISEIEPNGTFTTAQVLPTLDELEVRAPINPAGDIDYYTGNATAGDKIWAYLFTGQSTSGADTELRLLNAVSNTIQFDDDNGSQTAASSNIAGAPITATGAIYFRLNEFNNDGTVTPYSLFIDRTSSTPNVTEVEPNDVFTQANMVTVGDLITGTISITTDLDVFGFTANAGDRIIFQADGDPERDGVDYNPNFQILDSAGAQLVAVDSDSPLGDERSEAHAFTFGAAGTYYVRMSSDSSNPPNQPTGTYNLHLWRTASPPCASATPAATSTPVPPTFTATTVVTSTNTTVVTSTNTTVVTSTNTVAVATATCVPVANTPVAEVEPNNTFTQTNSLSNISGAEVRGGITPAGDQDFFSFQVSAGDRIWTYINTSNAAPSTDSILTLVNPTGGVVQLDDDNGFQSTLSSAIAGGVITTTGTHAIGVRQFGGATIMNPYSLYIDRTSGAAVPEVEPNNVFTQANAYNFGTVVTGSIPISTDLDYFVFTLALNDKIVIQVDGDPDRNGTNLSRVNQFNPNFALLDANGAPITTVDSDSQGGNGGLLSENLVFTNTNILSTTFGVRVTFDPSTPVEDDLGIYNLHIFKVGGAGACPGTATPSVVVPTSTATAVVTGSPVAATPTVCVPTSGTWTAVATIPAPGRYNVSGVMGTDGKFYVMAGMDSANAAVANNDVFDPVTNAWSSASPVPSPVQSHPALGSVAGKIYMSGGSVPQPAPSPGTVVSTTRIYDIGTNSWSTGANAPTAFRAAEYATHGGNLYVFGGIDAAGVPLTTTMIYSTTANSWSMGAPLPDVKFYGFAAEWGGMIYLYGGANNTAVNSTLWRYNPATNTFATLTSGPNARIRLAMSARDGKLYATGGSTTPGNSFAQTNTVDVYDIGTDTWSAGPNMIAPRNTHVQGTLPDGRIIAAVGLTTGNVRTQSAEVLPLGVGCPTVTVGPTNTVGTVVATTSPTVCPTQVVALSEGFEAGTLGAFTQTVIITSTTTPVPTPGWASVAANPHSGTRSAFAPDPDRTTDSRLATINGINIPAGVSTATLTFWHRFAFENLFDGGVLEVSTDNGATWADADANIQQGGYNGTITVFQGCVTAGTPPPFPAGKRVWTGSMTTYAQVRVNLVPYAGNTIKFRFRLGTDCSVSNTGWNVDDVEVALGGGCPTTPTVVPPSSTVPPTITAGTVVASPTVCAASVVNLVLDDGTVENSVGWTNSTMNFTAIWINRSSPPAASFPMNLTNISIKWPNSAALVGKTIALLVYLDADADGNPANAVKVAQVNGQTITVANGTTFQDFPVNVNIPTAGDVYYGFADTYNSGGVSPRTFPAPLDTTATQGRSWVSAQDDATDPDFDNLGNNDNLGTIDDLSGGALTGNWVIRASGTGGGGCVTPSPEVTPGATATCVPVTGGWVQGALLPVPLVRAWGVYFPPNGKFYAMGGRTADGTGTAQLNPLEYTPSTDTWITKTAVFSDQQTSNVQGGVLTMNTLGGNGSVIVIVGGSAGGGTGGTTETRIYDPVADTLTTLETDPWTPGTTTVPGGSAVWNNKLYIFGGFDIPGAIASDDIWELDLNRAPGSRWVLKTAVLPTPLAYIPAATIGNFIYTGGGSLIEGGTLADSDLAFRYDPATDTITSIATLPNVTAETRGVNVNNELWVLGGGRDAPNPTSNVLIYSPGTDTWRMGEPFVLGRRNFPADTDGMGHIYLAGGYAPSAPTDNMEIFTKGVSCGSPTVVPATNTATPSNTAVATSTRTSTSVPTTAASATSTNTTGPTSTSTSVPPTSCPLNFIDVPPTDEFYTYIRCLVCRFIISGYNDRTFRPNNNIIRGQIAKMVSNSADFDEDPGDQIYEDVPPSNEFYSWINRLSRRGVMTGYPCGSNIYEPCGPENRPYFRWNANATRGQISQIVARGAGIVDPPGDQRYTDVPPESTFFIPIQQLSNMGVMSGYPCGGVNPQTGQAEPCDDLNRPYFRPGNLATRAQASKIVANTFFPGCVTPGGPLNSDVGLPNKNMLRSSQPVPPAKPASND
jgi:hypothetical protein